MLLKIFLSIAVSAVFLNAAQYDILSKTKRGIIENEKKQNKKNSDILKFDWINPITGSYSHTISTQTSPSQTIDNLSISLNQPIFRSGGIYYAIKYANANREFLKFATSLSEKSLLTNAYTILLNLKNLDLSIEKQKLLIKNAAINITVKKEQYLKGLIDSSFLDNAILNKNSLDIGLLNMQSSKVDLEKQFKVISSLNYKNIKLPHLKLINLSKFLKSNLVLKDSMANIKQTNYLKKMTISKYLPTVSLFANYNSSRISYIGTVRDSYKQYGVNISMPLFDINRGKNIQLQKLKYLKSKLEMIDKKHQEKELYKSIVEKIKIYYKKIALAKKQERLYASLLSSTKDLYKAGEKTVYDVDTMQNSLRSTKIEKYIYKNDIDLLLLSLYAHIDDK